MHNRQNHVLSFSPYNWKRPAEIWFFLLSRIISSQFLSFERSVIKMKSFQNVPIKRFLSFSVCQRRKLRYEDKVWPSTLSAISHVSFFLMECLINICSSSCYHMDDLLLSCNCLMPLWQGEELFTQVAVRKDWLSSEQFLHFCIKMLHLLGFIFYFFPSFCLLFPLMEVITAASVNSVDAFQWILRT